MLRCLVGLVFVCGLVACNQIFGIPDVKTSNDACGDKLAKCDLNASCTDTTTGYTCACNSGFSGDGTTCTDVDECSATPPVCAVHATCTNSPGSYTCACDSGFSGDGTYCVPATWLKISPAGGFACGLGEDGGMYCWGNNDDGQLGDGTYLPHARPVQVGTSTDWIDVGARYLKACGLRSDHSIWCWGYGEQGMLGDGQMKTEPSPTMVISDKTVGFKSLSVGKYEVCGIHDDGSLACWGNDRVTNTVVPKPVAVDANTDWTYVSGGGVQCGLRNTTGGNLYCWGRSTNGDLGLGAVTTQATPARVGTDTWRTVSMGYFNACAIRTDGTLWCWGNDPTDSSILQYGTAPMELSANTDWTSISMSIDTVGGIRGGGTAYVWGDNSNGQLGEAALGDFPTPTPIGGTVTGWSSIIAGNSHTCGISNGKGYCWGSIGDGDLGNGVAAYLYSPTKIGTTAFSSVQAGSIGKCAIGTAGELYCWGSNTAGVGFGNTDPVWVPTRLGTDTWSSVSVDANFPLTFCGIHSGVLSCWGDNSTGALGIGNQTSPQLSPVPVNAPTGTTWSSVSTSDHTCAITNTGDMYCWGDDNAGELGNGATSATPTTAPTTALGGSWLQTASAINFSPLSTTLAIRSDHTLWYWGLDIFAAGQTNQTTPAQLGTATDWAQISTLVAETCGVKLDGTLWCAGQFLGDGTTNTSLVPVQVGTDTHWKSVAVGSEVCGVKTDGTLWCFGDSGNLGNGKKRIDPVTQSIPPTLSVTQIGTDSDWASVDTRGDSCAIKTDGSLWCWGYGAAPFPQYVSVPTPIE